MSDLKNWSDVAADNSETPPDGWPEGMLRSDVNNSAREMMRALIDFYRNAEWITVYVTTGDAWAATKDSATVIRLTPQDGQTAEDISDRFPAGSRFRWTTDTPSVQEGFVVSGALSTDDTLITVVVDDGTDLDAGVSSRTLEIGVVRDLLEKTAYYPTGATRSQTPPQVPTIDDLGTAADYDTGSGNGLDADTVDGLHASQLITSASAPGKNVVYNPGMLIWQRGTSIDNTTTNGRIYVNDDNAYVADRWRLLSGNSTGSTDNLVTVAVDTTSAPTGQYQSMKFTTQSYTAGDKFGIFQVLDAQDSGILIGSGAISMGADFIASGTLSGIRMKVLGWSGGADHANLSLTPISDWGTVGAAVSFAANWTEIADSGTLTISTAWERETMEDMDISAYGAITNIGILIYADSVFSAGNTLNITGVRLENSTVAGTFSPNDYTTDLLRCQRYFNTTFDYGEDPRHGVGLPGAATGLNSNATSNQGIIEWRFPVEMRTDPTMNSWNPSNATPAANENVYAERTGADMDITSFTERISQRSVSYHNDNVNPTNTTMHVHLVADAEF